MPGLALTAGTVGAYTILALFLMAALDSHRHEDWFSLVWCLLVGMTAPGAAALTYLWIQVVIAG